MQGAARIVVRVHELNNAWEWFQRADLGEEHREGYQLRVAAGVPDREDGANFIANCLIRFRCKAAREG